MRSVWCLRQWGKALPSGKTHSRCANAATVLVAVGGWLREETEIAIYMAAGIIIADRLLSPDLDSECSDALSRWNAMRLGFLWGFYSEFKHRSPHTHWPIWSDAIRNVYILFMMGLTIAMIISLFRLDLFAGPLTLFGWINKATTLNPHLCLAFFAGQCINTTLHTSADMITSESKKIVDRKRKPKPQRAGRAIRRAA